MPLGNVRKVIRFLQISKIGEIGIIGGEPTLHPKFISVVKLILDSGIKIHLFSNGIVPFKHIEFLSLVDKDKCDILLNINPLQSYNRQEKINLTKTLVSLNNKISLGFTIYQENFSASFMLPIIKKYNLKKIIRISQAHRLFGFPNRYLPLSARSFVAKRIVNFAQECDRKDVVLNFDCGFSLCSFSVKDLGRLRLYGAGTNMLCNPVIDVSPDLTLFRCFATSKIWNKKLDDFNNLNQIYNYYQEKSLRFIRLGNNGKCLHCKYMERLQCAGGCLSFTLSSLGLQNKDGTDSLF
jgi:cyclic pyranopterin phosphate synthase